MNKTKIDWCDSTLNPVVGCLRNCEYCYARKINDRFKWVRDFAKPVFFPKRLEQLKSKKPKSIFMNSMSDYEFWDRSDCYFIYKAINNNPQHNYIFLTKGNELFKYAKNCFNGKTVTNENEMFDAYFNGEFDFYSIEPILMPMDLLINIDVNFTRLIIIGAETGNRKDKIVPKKEWIDNIVKQADEMGIKVFMKNSLKDIMGVDFRQDELLWIIKK